METDADVTLSTVSPEKILRQRKVSAQRPRLDLSKTSTAVAAKTCFSKLSFSHLGGSRDCSRCELYKFESCNSVSFN